MKGLNAFEQFDYSFREAAQNAELPFNPHAWELMQKKLDGQSKRKFLWVWYITAALFVGLLGVYFYIANVKKNSLTTVNNHVVKPEETNSQIENNTAELATAKKSTSNHKSSTTSTSNNNLKANKNSNNANEGTAINSIANDNHTNSMVEKASKHLANKSATSKSTHKNIVINKADDGNKNFVVPANASSGSAINDKPITKKENTNIANIALVKPATKYYTASSLALHKHYVTDVAAMDAETKVLKEKADAEKAEENAYRLMAATAQTADYNRSSTLMYVTAGIAANLSYVSRPEIKNTRPMFSLGIGININRDVSLETGIMYGEKIFSVRREQFNYLGPGQHSKYITGIEGTSSVIDIPINLRYQISNKENCGWFIKAGFSTWFMKNESYDVSYNYGSGTKHYFQTSDKNQSVLRIFNLSVGYQFLLNKHFTVIAEPYVKLPIDRTGVGSTLVSSAGLQISGRFSFIDKKVKK